MHSLLEPVQAQRSPEEAMEKMEPRMSEALSGEKNLKHSAVCRQREVRSTLRNAKMLLKLIRNDARVDSNDLDFSVKNAFFDQVEL